MRAAAPPSHARPAWPSAKTEAFGRPCSMAEKMAHFRGFWGIECSRIPFPLNGRRWFAPRFPIAGPVMDFSPSNSALVPERPAWAEQEGVSVAEMVVFLVTAGARNITGQCFNGDGGL